MRYRFLTADVFTDRIFGGNPLAVLPDARGLRTEQMQRIAAEFNLSETTFVLPAENSANTRRVRIFVPTKELPFAGHPTVGTAFVLATIGEVKTERVIFEEGVGPVQVNIRYRDGRPVFCELIAAKIPEFGPQAPPVADIAGALCLSPTDIATGGLGARGITAGIPFLAVPLASLEALARARIDSERWRRAFGSWWSQQVYMFHRQDGRLRARMYAPTFGIAEDPATGSAAAAIAGYLFEIDGRPNGLLKWTIEQGVEMGRPSILQVEAKGEGGKLTEVRVGGASVLVTEGTIEVPD